MSKFRDINHPNTVNGMICDDWDDHRPSSGPYESGVAVAKEVFEKFKKKYPKGSNFYGEICTNYWQNNFTVQFYVDGKMKFAGDIGTQKKFKMQVVAEYVIKNNEIATS